ncbi:MAG: DUF3426 domain-containing protein [Thaumarchaeota archaeon]|nr:DUF3426 domain-containing protein [Nitrososphaerota archaeon]
MISQAAYAEVVIQNDQKYIDNDGLLHIVGEIENNTSAPLNQIKISALLIDGDGNEIKKIVGETVSNVVMPETKGAFDILIKNVRGDSINDYELNLDYTLAAPKNQVIEISSTELTKDIHNNTVITGILENKGELTANIIRVVATLYDRDGNVVTVSETYTKPDFLRAGDNSNFIIPFHEKSQSIHAVEYSITAESDEYVAVPEFPLGTGVLLIISVSSYILFSRNPEKVVNIISNVTNTKRLLRQKQD